MQQFLYQNAGLVLVVAVLATLYIWAGVYSLTSTLHRFLLEDNNRGDNSLATAAMWLTLTFWGAVVSVLLALTWPVWFALPAALGLFFSLFARPRVLTTH